MGKRRAAKKTAGKNGTWLRGQIAKGDLSPIYFLYGPEDLEKEEAVKALIDAADRDNPAIYPPAEVIATSEALVDVGDAARLYDEAWTAIQAA